MLYGLEGGVSGGEELEVLLTIRCNGCDVVGDADEASVLDKLAIKPLLKLRLNCTRRFVQNGKRRPEVQEAGKVEPLKLTRREHLRPGVGRELVGKGDVADESAQIAQKQDALQAGIKRLLLKEDRQA